MRKLVTLFLLLFLCLPSMVLASTKQHTVALCNMTPYKLFEKMQTDQPYLEVKNRLRFFDVHKVASSSELVFCKVGKDLPNCTMHISAFHSASGLTQVVSIRVNNNTSAAQDDFINASVLVFYELGFSLADIDMLYKQGIPSPSYDNQMCSIWKNDRRIVVFSHFNSIGYRSVSFYAVNTPRYMR